ncbi:MAG: DUF4034 domain-containing protein [Gemmatimonadetes bacterium]|nr:DUF4034 domain-containing protein [Gemmatimonadota bacterium]
MASWTFKVPLSGGPVLVLSRGWDGRTAIALRGVHLERLSYEDGEPFVVPMADGTTEKILVRKIFLDPVPRVQFRDQPIELVPPMRWWEWALGAVPVGLAFTVTLPGVLMGIMASVINLLLLRGWQQPIARLVAVVAISGTAIGGYQTLNHLFNSVVSSPMADLITSLPLPKDDNGRTAAASDVTVAPQDADTLAVLRGALERSQFDSLELVLGRLERDALTHPRSEIRWGTTLKALGYAGPAAEVQMDAWLAARPASHLAHLVRASAYVRSGLLLRGDQPIKTTTRQQLDGMKREFRRAELEIASALRSDPMAIGGYWLLLSMAQARGDAVGAAEAFRRALMIQPLSLRSYILYALVLDPQSGGSLKALGKLADQADSRLAEEPRLRAVRGFLSWVESRDAVARGDFATATEAAQAALLVGDDWRFHAALGRAQRGAGDIAGATAAMEKALVRNPIEPSVRFERSRLLYDRLTATPDADSADAWLSESRREANVALDLDGATQRYRDWVDSLALIKPKRRGA